MVRWFKKANPAGLRLGPLEAYLLGALRRRGDATVRELISENEMDVAYTTVMTTLDRLYKKGLVERVSVGGRSRAFRYRLSRPSKTSSVRSWALISSACLLLK